MATALILVGGVFQIGGVVAVVVSLRDTLRGVGRFEHRTQMIFGAGGINGGGKLGVVTVTGGRPPTLEGRMVSLEGRFANLRDEIKDEVKTELKAEIERTRRAVTDSYKYDFQQLSSFTTETLRSQRRPTVIGASFLIVGVILATIGSVIA
jgi:hypothetical protein